ncbi:MAG: hypothetical protein Q8P59_11010, partial [Dehalococcoidia bacterium]|nr:hypothetical protein [Dehalococcoidia bacterium]
MNLKPMLASLEKDVWDSHLHLFENKWNGLRIVGHCEGESVRLQGSSGADFTLQFPEVFEALRKAVKHPAIVDGEIVCLDERGLPCFNLIQNRIGKRDQAVVKIMIAKSPAIYQVFDVTSVFQQDITVHGKEPATLMQRKDILSNLVTGNGAVKLSPWIDGRGKELFEKVKALGQEGIMAKLKTSLYIPGGRNTDWLKMKVWKTDTFVVGGYTMGTGWRSDIMG